MNCQTMVGTHDENASTAVLDLFWSIFHRHGYLKAEELHNWCQWADGQWFYGTMPPYMVFWADRSLLSNGVNRHLRMVLLFCPFRVLYQFRCHAVEGYMDTSPVLLCHPVGLHQCLVMAFTSKAGAHRSTPSYPLGWALEPITQIITRALEMIFTGLPGKVHLLHESINRILTEMTFGLNGSGFAEPMPDRWVSVCMFLNKNPFIQTYMFVSRQTSKNILK